MAGRFSISRRSLLVGGGAGIGLAIAFMGWPRHYRPNLSAAPGEHLFNAFLKIGEDGHVAVAVPQAEMGQGVFTSLPQVLADALGADWRTVAVEPAPIGPLYANDFLAKELARDRLPVFLHDVAGWAGHEYATRSALMMTAGSTSIRGFAGRFAEAGAAARAMLCMAAAKRWGISWEACETADGFVTRGPDRLRFAELAAEAAAFAPPEELPLREAPLLIGRSVPRLDLPAKVDGSARYAADVRLPDMAFAAIRQRPPGAGARRPLDRKAAETVPGALMLVEQDGWQAAVGETSWAAAEALDRAGGGFAPGAAPDNAAIERALRAALGGTGEALVEEGKLPPMPVKAEYRVGLAAHAAIEPMCATARYAGDRLEIWAPTQAPGLLRAAAARTLGLSETQVTIYPMLHGGSFGAKMEVAAACQAAVIAARARRPVQLQWSRAEDLAHDRFRPPALASLSAGLAGPRIVGWQARIAVPASFGEVIGRIMPGAPLGRAAAARAVEGARPPYAIPAASVTHHPAAIGVATGLWRSESHSYTAFFTECFMDELAGIAGLDPLSFRMGQLSGNPRLARCLSAAATLGGWEGGSAGQGLACHSAFGSHIAVLAEVAMEGGRPRVTRIAAAVDCGRAINPDIVHQQIEGGLIFGLGAALGPVLTPAGAASLDALALPRLAGSPDIAVELIATNAPSGGVSELAVPVIGPAVANALAAATGRRIRSLPLI
ncbi:xanthine dehydrogenase family protein molybdopterin-binding subunit [Sphingomonas quercus]|uniref:Molybdopterin-dependent oxidoreductase n=1 Tax=Sphingomonas quercus TaxID=2842451 RepID=A0ABS6BJ18_9SPHN|nr:molybdopterin cofactor-binding domain-containing protein [Sphingomonas quercus]MBU3078301.1 molybdopterin-dependent oxidoreductase [Sphingomonas quercus]